MPRDGGEEPEQPPGAIWVNEQQARVWIIHGDRVELTRAPLAVTLHTAAPLSDAALIHPYLALPAAIASRWLGRQVLHGGAFVLDGGAWALTADKGGGKSTTLAGLLQQGLPILTDDLLMIDDVTVFAGPRSIDLRDEAAELLGGEPLGFLGTRERWRVRPPECPPEARLAGFVTLCWGEKLSLEPLGARERLEHLAEHSFMGPAREDQLATLTLAALPAWRLTRPRDLNGLTDSVARLLAGLG